MSLPPPARVWRAEGKLRWPRGGGSAPSALLRAAASAGLGGPGGAGRGLQPPVQSGARSAAPQAFGRTEERAGERSRGAIEVARREGRGAGRVELRPLSPGWTDIGERGGGGPPAPYSALREREGGEEADTSSAESPEPGGEPGGPLESPDAGLPSGRGKLHPGGDSGARRAL